MNVIVFIFDLAYFFCPPTKLFCGLVELLDMLTAI